MFCKHCGQQIPDDSTYCFNCGNVFEGAQPEQPAQPQPQQQYQQSEQPAQPQYQQPAQPQYQQPAHPQYQQPAQPVYQQPQPQFQQPAQPQYQQPGYAQPAFQTPPVPAKRPSAAALVMAIIGLVSSVASFSLIYSAYSSITRAISGYSYFYYSSAESVIGSIVAKIVFSLIFAIIGLIFGIIGTVKGAKVTRIVPKRPATHTVALILGIIATVLSAIMIIFFFICIAALSRVN